MDNCVFDVWERHTGTSVRIGYRCIQQKLPEKLAGPAKKMVCDNEEVNVVQCQPGLTDTATQPHRICASVLKVWECEQVLVQQQGDGVADGQVFPNEVGQGNSIWPIHAVLVVSGCVP